MVKLFKLSLLGTQLVINVEELELIHLNPCKPALNAEVKALEFKTHSTIMGKDLLERPLAKLVKDGENKSQKLVLYATVRRLWKNNKLFK